MDKKTFEILKYLYDSEICSFDQLEERYGTNFRYSAEFIYLRKNKFIQYPKPSFSPKPKSKIFFSVTPEGRDAIESYNRDRRKYFIIVGTFVIAILSFLLNLSRYL